MRKPLKPVFILFAKRAKLRMCAMVCTRLKKAIDHPTALWKVMLERRGKGRTVSMSATEVIWLRRVESVPLRLAVEAAECRFTASG